MPPFDIGLYMYKKICLILLVPVVGLFVFNNISDSFVIDQSITTRDLNERVDYDTSELDDVDIKSVNRIYNDLKSLKARINHLHIDTNVVKEDLSIEVDMYSEKDLEAYIQVLTARYPEYSKQLAKHLHLKEELNILMDEHKKVLDQHEIQSESGSVSVSSDMLRKITSDIEAKRKQMETNMHQVIISIYKNDIS